jgi:GT2 family glycosyltransferase
VTVPAVSVIVPTHNRRASLVRTLQALALQTWPAESLEVLVVADGCTDGTGEAVRGHALPFSFRLLQQPGLGAAAARNAGAAAAAAKVLLFIDDDVEPTPALVSAHVRAHGEHSDRVVLGPYPPVLPGRADLFRVELRRWWHDHFTAASQPGHRFTYRDLLAGNLSISAELYRRTGGFDPGFAGCGGEDWEYGVRLLDAGATFVFAPDALGHHHEASDHARSLRRARQEGRADVIIARRHPGLRPSLAFGRGDSRRAAAESWASVCAFRCPWVAALLPAIVAPLLRQLERLRLRRSWQRLSRALRSLAYWQGVSDELKTSKALAGLLQSGPARSDAGPEATLDLRDGIAAAERRLDAERPAGARLCYGDLPVGRIPPEAGAEGLRGAHLRPALVERFAVPYLTAIALARAVLPAHEEGWLGGR